MDDIYLGKGHFHYHCIMHQGNKIEMFVDKFLFVHVSYTQMPNSPHTFDISPTVQDPSSRLLPDNVAQTDGAAGGGGLRPRDGPAEAQGPDSDLGPWGGGLRGLASLQNSV